MPQVFIDFRLLRKIEGDRPVDLLERQYRKTQLDCFGGGASPEGIDDGIQRHSGPTDPKAGITLPLPKMPARQDGILPLNYSR